MFYLNLTNFQKCDMYHIVLHSIVLIYKKGIFIMKSEIYAIYDEASEAFVQFMSLLNSSVARMTFSKLFKDGRINIPMIYDYPSCYKVYKIGIFDDNTGLFENAPQHEMLLSFSSLVPSENATSSSS